MLEAKNKYESTLHRRFVIRVLAPPFIALLILFVVGLWQLNRILYRQAIDGLKLSATTTAATLEREFTLRETILKQTGTELFIIKSEYKADRKKLDDDRDACRVHIQQKSAVKGSPNNVCDSFQVALSNNSTLLTSLEAEYLKIGEKLIENHNQRINDRLTAYKQFFPETLALVVVDNNKQPVSSALSGVFKNSAEVFQADAVAALKEPITGQLMNSEGFELATFAFPITGGSVLAAYDIKNEHFIKPVWEDAPVDRTRALAILVGRTGYPAYPQLKDGERIKKQSINLRQKTTVKVKLDNVDHIAVASAAGKSDWLAVVASPSAAVLAPVRDAQLAGVVVIGLFMIGFLWVGTFFIQRTLRSIVGLVSGAIVFGSGRLDYKIALDHADGDFMRLADTMNAMAARIAATEKAIAEKNKEFISIATHELRAPLTAIIGQLSIFQEMYEDKLETKAKYLIDQSYYGTVRMRDLVNDMLNVARLEGGHSEFALAQVAIKPIVEDIVSNMTVVAQIAKVNLHYKNIHAADVIADEQRLRIIINNFVSNAIKYNRPGGNVNVSHEVKDDQLVTKIEDNGLGIPENQKAHMFEKFFRVEHEDRKSVTGTGLGMYITRQYIEQMQGKLWYESTHGKGTVFYFSLPLAKPPQKSKFKKLIKRK